MTAHSPHKIFETLDEMGALLNEHQAWQPLLSDFRRLSTIATSNPVVLVMGEFSVGKSTFLNALLGGVWLKSTVKPTTAIAVFLRYSEEPSLVAHMLDGSKLPLDFWRLHDLSSEATPGDALLRGMMKHLEVSLPADILRDFTLVDTPGLNSSHEVHTRATESLFDSADDTLWLFRYGSVGKQSESDGLKKLANHGIRPLGLVNFIDLHEDMNASEELEDVMVRDKARLRGQVRDLIGISALDALEGKMKPDAEQAEWSNFAELYLRLEDLKSLKITRFAESMLEFSLMLEKRIEELNELEERQSDLRTFDYFLAYTTPELETFLEESERKRLDLRDHRMLVEAFFHVASFDELIDRLELTELPAKPDLLMLARILDRAVSDHEQNVTDFRKLEAEIREKRDLFSGSAFGMLRRAFASKKKLNALQQDYIRLGRLRNLCIGSAEQLERIQSGFKTKLELMVPRLEHELNHLSRLLFSREQQAAEELQQRFEQERQYLLSVLRRTEIFANAVRPLIQTLKIFKEQLNAVTLQARPADRERLRELQVVLERSKVRLSQLENGDMLEKCRAAVETLSYWNPGPEKTASISFDIERMEGSLSKRTPYVPDLIPLNTFHFRPLIVWALALSIFGLFVWPNRADLIGSLLPTRDSEAVQAEISGLSPAAAAEASIGSVTIAASELHVRRAPDGMSASIGTLKQGVIVEVKEIRDGWLRIGLNKWISGNEKYVRYEPNS